MPQDLDPLPFQVDHIIASKHGGLTSEDNLALACFYCNTNKGPNIASVDPEIGEVVRLFNPRTDAWTEHFSWHGPVLSGRTGIGRATVQALRINDLEYVNVRTALMEEGVFPRALI
jgi:hypothetical protein